MFSRRFLRIKVVKALYAHQTGAADSVAIEEKELLKGLDKDYDLYHYVLSLIAEVKRYAEERIEMARNKHLPTEEDLNPNLKFISNQVIARIEADAELDHILAIKKLVNEMTDARHVANHLNSQVDKAYSYEEKVNPYMQLIREHIDMLEMEVDDEIWPLPKYRELLFTK
jgi:glutamine synthetase type III